MKRLPLLAALILYLQGGYGIDQHRDGLGFLGHRTLGQVAVGLEYDGLYVELEHTSDVQVADEHGGYNVLWVGFRKQWTLSK